MRSSVSACLALMKKHPLQSVRNLTAVALLAGAPAMVCAAPDFDAEPSSQGSAPHTAAQTLEKLKKQASPAMKSRTCGLVLLSHGRALAAQLKGPSLVEQMQGHSQVASTSMSWLVSAFLLLRDGREAAGPESRELYAAMSPQWTPTEAAMIYCTNWFESRRKSETFDVSEAAKWEAAASAKATFDTEQPR